MRDRRAGERTRDKEKETIRRGRDGDRAGRVRVGRHSQEGKQAQRRQERRTTWFVDMRQYDL